MKNIKFHAHDSFFTGESYEFSDSDIIKMKEIIKMHDEESVIRELNDRLALSNSSLIKFATILDKKSILLYNKYRINYEKDSENTFYVRLDGEYAFNVGHWNGEDFLSIDDSLKKFCIEHEIILLDLIILIVEVFCVGEHKKYIKKFITEQMTIKPFFYNTLSK